MRVNMLTIMKCPGKLINLCERICYRNSGVVDSRLCGDDEEGWNDEKSYSFSTILPKRIGT